jgi:tetratricopeptide (TPR) repeat protein
MKNAALLFIVFLAFAKANSVQAQPVLEEEKIILYWDASLSMQDRNLLVEIEHLDSFFQKHQNVIVHYISFSSEIISEVNFRISDGNWTELKEELKTTIYDGAVSFKPLDFTLKTDLFIISTDGKSISSQLPIKASAPVHIITDNTSNAIKRLTLNTNGSLIDTKKLLLQQNRQPVTIEGYVIDNNKGERRPLSGARIKIVGDETEAVTDHEGKYTIEAYPENILEVSYVGKPSRRFRAGDSRSQNFTFNDEGDTLKEVVLTGKSRGTIAPEDKEVNLGQHKIQKKKLGYAVTTITDEQISPLDKDVREAVKGQFAGIRIANDAVTDRVDLTQFTGRQRNMSIQGDQTGLVVIDGMPQSKATGSNIGVTSNIDPTTIASITYLKGLAATNRYGSLGKGGVILITTKTYAAAFGETQKKDKTPLGTTGTYSDSALQLESLPETAYIKELKKQTTIDGAFEEYLAQRDIYGSSPDFYLTVADYFKGWNNIGLTSRILSNVSEIVMDDADALRAMAFKMEELGESSKALDVYKYINRLRPLEVQSYRDLALSYTENGKINEALLLYQNILEGKGNFNLNTTGIKESLVKEYKNFIRKYKSVVNTNEVSPMFLKNPERLKKRIVLEWSHQDAKFDLQIINPQNRFFTWEHTEKASLQRLTQEKKDGFQMEEFFLTKNDKGTWKFNVVYYGKTSINDALPTYVKFTVFSNYGSSQETKEIKVVSLQDLNQPYSALEISL